jgi:acyl carrier protein
VRLLRQLSSVLDNQQSDGMPDQSTALLRDRLVELVKELLAKHSIARPVSVDEQLTQAGLSSIDMVNLMLAVEAEFNIMIPATEITPANFRSILTIEALIVRIEPRVTRQ